MPRTLHLTEDERELVLSRVKPTGPFKPSGRQTVGVQPIPWEERLGDLDQWRENKGMGRQIVPVLKDPAQTDSIRNSIVMRLRKLFADESWSTYVEGRFVYLKFNGPKRSYASRGPNGGGSPTGGDEQENDQHDGGDSSDGLFANAG